MPPSGRLSVHVSGRMSGDLRLSTDPVSYNLCRHVRTVGDDAVHPPIEQTSYIRRLVDRPYLDGDSGLVRQLHKAWRHDARRAAGFGHLKRSIRHTPWRDAAPRSVQRHPDFEPGAARGDVGRDRARGTQRRTAERSEAHTMSAPARRTSSTTARGERGPGFLQFDDDAGVRVPLEHVAQRRHVQLPPGRRRCDRRADPLRAWCDRASHHDEPRQSCRARGGRRARGHRRRPSVRDRTP